MISPSPRARFAEALLTPEQREAWREACESKGVQELGSLGAITNGYVSGDNEFFHRTRDSALQGGVPEAWLRPAARSSRSLQGLSLTRQDIAAHESRGAAHHLIVPPRDACTQEAMQVLRAEGEGRGTPDRYKCRVRQPWWLVPGLAEADVLLGYMSGEHPRAAVNEARALYTNSLHGLRLGPGVEADAVALAMHSSFALLSLEIEGRSYGGGILKLEPTEMRHARVAVGDASATDQVDALLRADRYDEAVELVDRVSLIQHFGWSERRVGLLQSAWRSLRARRTGRARLDRPRPLRKVSPPVQVESSIQLRPPVAG